jgi:hypothetical protein
MEHLDGMRIDRGNRNTRRKPSPDPLLPPQIPHDLTWDQTLVPAIGSRRLTTLFMAQPNTAHYVRGILYVPSFVTRVK